MCKIIAVISGKGGVGKSSFSVGLAIAFARLKKKVLLIDMDEGLRCLDLMLGMDEKIVFDLGDILTSKDFSSAIYKSEKFSGIYLIPAPNKKGRIESESLKCFAEEISKEFDIVIFDFPAGIMMPLYEALPKRTKFLTVAVPDSISVRDAYSINASLRERGLSSGLIINRFDIKKMRKGIYHNIDEMIDLSGIKLYGIVPESKEIALFYIKQRVKKKGKAQKAFNRIAGRIDDKKIRLPKFKKI